MLTSFFYSKPLQTLNLAALPCFYARFNPSHVRLSSYTGAKQMKQSFEAIFQKTPVLPRKIKVFLALLAVNSLNCHSLASILEVEFLAEGGDPDWLKGSLPEQYLHLRKLNAILAFQPWKLNQTQLKELLFFWNMSELVSAVFVLVFFHREALIYESFSFKKMSGNKENKSRETRETDSKAQFDCQSPVFSSRSLKSTQLQEFANFNEKGEEFLERIDFNWEDHAYYILGEHDASSAEAFNEEFGATFAEEPLEKVLLAGYIEFIMGYYNHDNNYSLINKVVSKHHKKFFKMVATEPQRISAEEAASTVKKYGELTVDLVILVLTTKMRLELIYFANALNGISLA